MVQIVTPAASERLATLDRIKRELNIRDTASDIILGEKLDEASSDVAAATGKRLPREDVTETYWHDDAPRRVGWFQQGEPRETTLFLTRTPVVTITSVTVDDFALDPSEWRLDPEAGLLDRLSPDGFPCAWRFCKAVVVIYTGGFVLPGNPDCKPPFGLPPGIQGAVVALVSDYWASRGRDPTLRSESVPGVIDRTYWVGAVGDPELLPPRVLASLSQFRRPALAVG